MPTIRCFQADVETLTDASRKETLTSVTWSSPGNPGEAGGSSARLFCEFEAP